MLIYTQCYVLGFCCKFLGDFWVSWQETAFLKGLVKLGEIRHLKI